MNTLYARRRRRNVIMQGLSLAATLFGLGWLVLDPRRPAVGRLQRPFAAGLHRNDAAARARRAACSIAIVGSLIMTVLAVLIGTPVGILAGTYMAEYGRHDRLTSVVRFINDILLSAPSIVIGLFIYEVMVAPMGHFSGSAGAVALAVIVLPVVVRTTEDMLLLVPDHAARGGRRARRCRAR